MGGSIAHTGLFTLLLGDRPDSNRSNGSHDHLPKAQLAALFTGLFLGAIWGSFRGYLSNRGGR